MNYIKKNKKVNHIVVNSDRYSENDYEMIQNRGYKTIVIDDVDGFFLEKKEKDNFKSKEEDNIKIFSDFLNIIVFLMKEKEINFIISVDKERKRK